MKNKLFTKDVIAIAIALIASFTYLCICGMKIHADETFTYPNGKTASDYNTKPDALNSIGAFESNGVYITSTDFYFLYDFCK